MNCLLYTSQGISDAFWKFPLKNDPQGVAVGRCLSIVAFGYVPDIVQAAERGAQIVLIGIVFAIQL